MKGNIYMQPHDEVSFAIQRSLDSAEALVEVVGPYFALPMERALPFILHRWITIR